MTVERARLVLHQFKWYLEVRLADLAESVSAKVTEKDRSGRTLTGGVMGTASVPLSGSESDDSASKAVADLL